MTIAEYRAKNSIIVESGGFRFKVRAPGVAEYALAGDPPNPVVEESGVVKEPSEAQLKKAKEFGQRMSVVIMTQCTTIVDADGKPSGEKIVDKLQSDCGSNEISYRELAIAEVNAIRDNATSQAMLSKEAAKAVIPFPEKQAPSLDVGQNSETLPAATN